MSAKPLVCSSCSRPLDRNWESIIYLGWSTKLDGKPGHDTVLALCAASLEELERGGASPCVQAAFKLLNAIGITPVPMTHEEWLAAGSADTIESRKGEQSNAFFHLPTPNS